ncbi:hypothetical protein F511_13519 [Dorcoceras hygrometricum]|uniref:FAM91 N-terminal domain-containing protein n=1 Tax=Dorcoceras hygrometricum TaxID=472368 RepID=A0A2Z7BDS3_9LAMI|nr:hypothetical protein F511_13519 [Dorcoceras hygrometricum]
MHRMPVTIEDQLIIKAIRDECQWENLPKRLQSNLNSKEEWHRRIIEYCLKKRLVWSTCFAKKVCKEGEYYEDMMQYLRKNLALFPYHLAEYVCRVMRLSPFKYYCEILFEVMRHEQPYDSIPNFSAADALRLTGIGRNEFIDIMNKCRSKKLSDEEMATIDKICKEEANSFILFDPEIIKGLYRRGLVYFDVPVYPDDRFKGLKSHAVTLYEAGKLGNASIADLCRDLITLEGTKFEGELQEFADHAFSLRCVLECLTSGGVFADGRDSIRSLSVCDGENNSLISDVFDVNKCPDSGPKESDLKAEDCVNPITSEGSGSAGTHTGFTSDEIFSSTLSDRTNSLDDDLKSGLRYELDKKSDSVEDFSMGRKLRKQRKYRVDILRCESLASLAPATLDRLFIRDYDIIMSMIPLPHSSVLPGSKGPIHFGPPSQSSMTPWMKLVLYSAVSSGPLSVVLIKGQCLRLLPAPLSGCEKAIVWSWDGSTVGGLGGKFEGNLVKGSILLHCLNSLLKFSAVLVQPLSRYDLDDGGKIVTRDVPLPLKNSDGSMARIGEELGLCKEESSKLNLLLHDISNKINLWSIGYIHLIRLFKERESESFSVDDKYEWVPLSVEFGIPLFSPTLCSNICKRVVSSELLQTDLLSDHHDAMQDLRSRLRNVCSEYQATGPTAKVLYQKEQPKEKKSRQLMTYASGRWNPLADPSSPISGALSEHQRLKLANRQRGQTEVLSFDGKILRSYALTPIDETAARPVEDSLSLGTTKGESEDSDSKEVTLPGVNLLFDGSELCPFEIGACLQANQPVSLIAEASAASTFLAGE